MVAGLRTYRLVLEYDGTDFHGFARQPGRRTVQGELERALAVIGGLAQPVTAAGRTDAGVHARGQVVGCRLVTTVPTSRLGRALNRLLPPDLAVLAAAMASEGFDACRDAVGKLYSYRILNRAAPAPLLSRQVWHHPRPLDAAAMRRAARGLVGRHDFRAYRSAGGSAKTAVREVKRLEVEREGDLIIFWCEADGFLYRMVRNLVGTLVRVGEGAWEIERPARILAGGDRRVAGPTAPARGLCLERVSYPGENSTTAMPTPGSDPS